MIRCMMVCCRKTCLCDSTDRKGCNTRVRAIWTHCLCAIHFVQEFSSCSKITIQLRSDCLVLSRIKNVFAVFFEDSLRTCHVSTRVVMSKSSWTVGSLYCGFWHVFQVQSKSGQSFCTQKRVLYACDKRYQKVLKECINHPRTVPYANLVSQSRITEGLCSWCRLAFRIGHVWQAWIVDAAGNCQTKTSATCVIVCTQPLRFNQRRKMITSPVYAACTQKLIPFENARTSVWKLANVTNTAYSSIHTWESHITHTARGVLVSGKWCRVLSVIYVLIRDRVFFCWILAWQTVGTQGIRF